MGDFNQYLIVLMLSLLKQILTNENRKNKTNSRFYGLPKCNRKRAIQHKI
jgi:hypothetical protein